MQILYSSREKNGQMEGFYDRVAQTIACSLEEGLLLEEDTLFFLESTYGIDAEALESILGDDDFDEIHAVHSLVFSPPDSTRAAVETLLINEVKDAADQLCIVDRLRKLMPSLQIVLPGASCFSCDFAQEGAEIMVRKLYMDRIHDPEVTQVLNNFLEKDQAVEVLVYIRCKAIRLTSEMKRFFRVFMSGTEHFEHISSGFICNFLKILAGTPEGTSPEKHFFRQKRQLRRTLFEIRIFKEKMEQYGMEYLLMQRYQVPHESEETVLEQAARIEFMLERVMGLKDPEEVYVNRRDLGSFDFGDDMEKLFRTLD